MIRKGGATAMSWEGKVTVGSVLALAQLLTTLGMGFYFVGQFQEKVASVERRMDGLEKTVADVGRSMTINLSRLNDRIDRLSERR